ncbi:hypothetical protein A3Q56_07680 [Intoshia linei]|uniref:Uncharacterized protein n=1 Tax=Intoshia linei TaxID=1819745 RepID=A0A177ATA7_9BILA|nr:hypothetical protein A3Q56_07680 [Intoshia linei]
MKILKQLSEIFNNRKKEKKLKYNDIQDIKRDFTNNRRIPQFTKLIYSEDENSLHLDKYSRKLHSLASKTKSIHNNKNNRKLKENPLITSFFGVILKKM